MSKGINIEFLLGVAAIVFVSIVEIRSINRTNDLRDKVIVVAEKALSIAQVQNKILKNQINLSKAMGNFHGVEMPK